MESLNLIINSIWFRVFLAAIPIAGLIAITINFRYSQRTRNANKYIMDLAEKNLKKDISEKELKNKKEEIEVYASKIDELKLQIKKDIPQEARRVVLLGQLDSQVNQLHKLRKEIDDIRHELSDLGEQTKLDEGLLRFLEKEIRPEYLIRDQRESLKTMLTMSTTATAIAYAVVPYEIRLFISVPLILFSAYLLSRLLKSYWKGFAILKVTIKKKAVLLCTIVGALSFSLAIFFSIVASSATYYNRDFPAVMIVVFGLITLASFIVAINVIFIRRKTAHQSP